MGDSYVAGVGAISEQSHRKEEQVLWQQLSSSEEEVERRQSRFRVLPDLSHASRVFCTWAVLDGIDSIEVIDVSMSREGVLDSIDVD